MFHGISSMTRALSFRRVGSICLVGASLLFGCSFAAAEPCASPPKISANSAHAAFLDEKCGVWMWGFNEAGQLATSRALGGEPAPVFRVKALPPLVDVTVAGDHTFGRAQDGAVYVWGSLEYVTCSETDRHSAKPTRIPTIDRVQSLAATKYLALFLRSEGQVYEQGCLDWRTGEVAEAPRKVAGLPAIGSVAVGSTHRLALSKEGEVYAWGGNHSALSSNAEDRRSVMTPTRVSGLPRIIAIAAGSWHSVALDADGGVWVWGSSQEWQLGLQRPTGSEPLQPKVHEVPVRVPEVPRIRAVSAGWFSTIAVTEDDRILFWGDRGHRGFPTPAAVLGLDGVDSAYPGGNAGVTDGIFARLKTGEFVRWQRTVGSKYEDTPSPPAMGRVTPVVIPPTP